jgi:hypothetical protein
MDMAWTAVLALAWLGIGARGGRSCVRLNTHACHLVRTTRFTTCALLLLLEQPAHFAPQMTREPLKESPLLTSLPIQPKYGPNLRALAPHSTYKNRPARCSLCLRTCLHSTARSAGPGIPVRRDYPRSVIAVVRVNRQAVDGIEGCACRIVELVSRLCVREGLLESVARREQRFDCSIRDLGECLLPLRTRKWWM